MDSTPLRTYTKSSLEPGSIGTYDWTMLVKAPPLHTYFQGTGLQRYKLVVVNQCRTCSSGQHSCSVQISLLVKAVENVNKTNAMGGGGLFGCCGPVLLAVVKPPVAYQPNGDLCFCVQPSMGFVDECALEPQCLQVRNYWFSD